MFHLFRTLSTELPFLVPTFNTITRSAKVAPSAMPGSVLKHELQVSSFPSWSQMCYSYSDSDVITVIHFTKSQTLKYLTRFLSGTSEICFHFLHGRQLTHPTPFCVFTVLHMFLLLSFWLWGMLGFSVAVWWGTGFLVFSNNQSFFFYFICRIMSPLRSFII